MNRGASNDAPLIVWSHYIPRRFGWIFRSPRSRHHTSNSTVARSSTSGTALPSFLRSTDLRYALTGLERYLW